MSNSCYNLITFWGNSKVLAQVKIWNDALRNVDVPADDKDRLSAIRLVFFPKATSDENVDLGSKWVRLNEVALTPEENQLALESANCRPEELENHIASLLYKADKKVVLKNNFNLDTGEIGVSYTAPYDEDGAYSQEALVTCEYEDFDEASDAEEDAAERLKSEEQEILEYFVDDMPDTKSTLKKNLPKGMIDWSSI